MSWGCVTRVGLLNARGNVFLLDNLALVLGAAKGRGSAPSLNHTCREICVISLVTFTIHHDVDQFLPSATESAPDRSCLLSSQPKPHELPVKKRKLESIREPAAALVLPTKVGEGRKQPRNRREEKRTCTISSSRCSSESDLLAPPLRRVVLARAEPSHSIHGPPLHGHAQRVSGLFENVDGRAECVGKVGRDGSGNAGTHYFQGHGHGAGDYLMAAVKFVGWIQSFADHPCAVRALKGCRRLAPGMSRGPVPWVAAAAMLGVAMVAKDECAVMLAIKYMAYLRPSELCNLTVGQVIRLLHWLGTSSRALLLAPQEELEGLENSRIRRKRSFGRSSFGRTGPSIDEIHSWQDVCDTPLELLSGIVRQRFFQMGRSHRSECDHDSSVLGSSRRSVIGCALANQSNDGNSKKRGSRKPRSCQTPRENMDNR